MSGIRIFNRQFSLATHRLAVLALLAGCETPMAMDEDVGRDRRDLGARGDADASLKNDAGEIDIDAPGLDAPVPPGVDAPIVRRDGGPAGPVPSWVPAPGAWAAVSSNTIDDVNPCPSDECSWSANQGISAVVDNWNGGAYATGFGTAGGYVVFGGGHEGYYGNEIYVWDVSTRAWTRFTEPVASPRCDQRVGELQDGSPCSAHTYSYMNYHPGTNSFVILTSASNHEVGGGGAPYVHTFDFDARTWRRGAAKSSFVSGTGASSAYDAVRDVFWYVPSYGASLGYWDPNADAWTELEDFWIDIDHQSAIEPMRDILVTMDGRNDGALYVLDLSDPRTPVVVRTSGEEIPTGEDPGYEGGLGFQFHPPSGTFVAWGGGRSVYQLVPPSGDWRTATWTWVRHTGSGPDPGGPTGSGTYNRWQWAPNLDAFLVVSTTSSPVFAYRPDF